MNSIFGKPDLFGAHLFAVMFQKVFEHPWGERAIVSDYAEYTVNPVEPVAEQGFVDIETQRSMFVFFREMPFP